MKRAFCVMALAILGGCLYGGDDESSVLRGDEAAARGALEEALAEYRLAVRQGAEDGETLARVAHTYVEMGRVDEATEFYRLAIAEERGLTDQASADMIRLALAAEERRDLFGVASAMEAAVEFQPGVTVPELALPLARHYLRSGEHGTALAYYQRALSAMEGDTIPEVLFETASAFDEVGDCQRALLFYEQYRGMIRNWQRGEVNWKIGNCSFRLGQELRTQDSQEEALELIRRTVELEEPKSIQALAYFEMGEILAELGRCEEALDAFLRVRMVDQTGGGPLVERAQWRYDELRFVGPRRDEGTKGC
jgi:tetratricopeptide (TPR) repeat protein